jgi:hypothetical protein
MCERVQKLFECGHPSTVGPLVRCAASTKVNGVEIRYLPCNVNEIREMMDVKCPDCRAFDMMVADEKNKAGK